MQDVVRIAFLYSLLPVITTVLAGIWATYQPAGSGFKSAVQHFAAGLVFSVVAVELLPDVIHASTPGVMLSFAAGTGLMLLEKISIEGKAKAAGGMGFVLAVAADVMIDGILIGVGVLSGKSQGKLLGIALAVEGVTLGLAMSTALLLKRGRKNTNVIIVNVSLFYAIGALVSSSLMAGMPQAVIGYVLSFGCAALLYLVTEELLVEAHAAQDAPWSALMFFVGFAMVELLKMLG